MTPVLIKAAMSAKELESFPKSGWRPKQKRPEGKVEKYDQR